MGLELQKKCWAVLKNENINWTKQVICSAHWTREDSLSLNDIPDDICSKEQKQKTKSLVKAA